jgi:hypothetical protein
MNSVMHTCRYLEFRKLLNVNLKLNKFSTLLSFKGAFKINEHHGNIFIEKKNVKF